MNIELLLQQIASVSNKYDQIYKRTGGYFNVFEITNVWADEVIMCKVLYELLSPKGSHFQGNKYLKLFIKNVLRLKMPDAELHSARVFSRVYN